MTEQSVKRGRKPLFGKAMSVAERQARHRAARAKERAGAAPVIEGVMGAAEMAALLKVGTMPAAQLASLMAQPGAVDCDDDQPALDEFGEPIFP